jgi:hypothetical protein
MHITGVIGTEDLKNIHIPEVTGTVELYSNDSCC